MKVLKGINGKRTTQEMSYEAICEELGFNADVKFVKVTRNGYIGFWAGKRTEVAALAHAVIDHDYYPSEGLRKMFPSLFEYAGF